MKDQQSTQAAISDLREAITNIDALAQEGFSQVRAIAQLAKGFMETGIEKKWQMDAVYYALGAICGKSEEIETCITSEASQVGCEYIDEYTRTSMNKFILNQPVV